MKARKKGAKKAQKSLFRALSHKKVTKTPTFISSCIEFILRYSTLKRKNAMFAYFVQFMIGGRL